ncbi:MAG: peptidase, partial [Planctomycetota bacterium]
MRSKSLNSSSRSKDASRRNAKRLALADRLRATQRSRGTRARNDRRLQSESLESRQLLAGPELVGIQPNEGELLVDNAVLSVSPRELVFRFDDDTRLDPETLDAIRLTRAGDDGVFESATATSDLGTNRDVLLEFRALQTGSIGNGLTLNFTSTFRVGNSLPLISVTGQRIDISLNNNPAITTSVSDLISAVADHPEAGQLVEVISVTGGTSTQIGANVPQNTSVTLIGANAAEGITDFGKNEVRVRFVSNLPGIDGRGTRIEFQRFNFGGAALPVVVRTGNLLQVQLNSTPGQETTVAELINRINSDPDASELVTAVLQEGDADSVIGDSTSLSPLVLTGVSDVSVVPGFVGLGDAVNEVIFRFAEPLPDDRYQLDILGEGEFALAASDGTPLEGGDFELEFEIDLGPKVLAVVPEPVRRGPNGQNLAPARGEIDVYFSERLNSNTAETTDFYQLLFTRDTVDNRDDVAAGEDPITPNRVDYDPGTNIATLFFDSPLSLFRDNNGDFIEGAARLRIGSVEALPAAPTVVSLANGNNPDIEPGDVIESAFDLGGQWTVSRTATSSAIVGGRIDNERAFELELPGPDAAGVRDTRSEDPTRLDGVVPLDYLRQGADSEDGIAIRRYDFSATYLGDDPNSPQQDNERTYFNTISDQQKQRVREAFELFSQYLGISFIEVEDSRGDTADFTIAVGDLYGADIDAVSGDGGQVVVTGNRRGLEDGETNLVVLDFQDFDESIDDQFGEEFFRGAMFGIGQLLGYGYADDLPQPVTQSTDFVLDPGTENEPLFPAPVDIVHGQYMYRPDSTDVDLYSFDVETSGQLKIEAFAERLPSASLLNTQLRLFRAVGNDLVEVASNDDFFSNDSFIDLEISAGSYLLGVSAAGNDIYDPLVRDSGFGGRTEGEYQIRIEFDPAVSTASIVDTDALVDLNGDNDFNDRGERGPTPLDGDGDGRPGGVFNFWFVPANGNNTLFVDKAASPTSIPTGSFQNPFRNIDDALARATPGTTVHVLGNGGADNRVETLEDNLSYQVGFASNGLPLADGSSLELPQGVRMVIDSSAIIKLSRARLAVGSDSPAVDRSDASLQILGTPVIIGSSGLPIRDEAGQVVPGSVYFTSINDREIGTANQGVITLPVQSGDWGGIDFRGDLDVADESRRNRENEGVFLNHVQYADLRYGGGAVSIGGRQTVVSPIDMAVTRPTVINSRITDSADAAMAATPETFAVSRFTTNEFQSQGFFTLDYDRVGPEIAGNFITDNSINGLFVRVSTRSGNQTETLSQTARFDDVDIVHVLTENLTIDGTAGGPLVVSSAPSSLLVRTAARTTGVVPAGSYVYRLTNVDSSGLESAASAATPPQELTSTGSIALSNLPAANQGSGFQARRLYRATFDPVTQLPGPFELVATLNATNTTFVDNAVSGTELLTATESVLRSRLDATLKVDAGTVVKLDGARIEARFGANIIAEGDASVPVVFTSLEDQRYGSGGTFDTNSRGDVGRIEPGQWGGVYVGQGGSASFDNAVLAGGGGQTRIEGGFASFNVIEVHQGDLRLANSRVEFNDTGVALTGTTTRVGRGENAASTVFVLGGAPVVINNEFVSNASSTLSFDVNSFDSTEVRDRGRASGPIDASSTLGNSGPLIEDNVLDNNAINGLVIRGGTLSTAGVWDDVDMVHVVEESISIPNQHINGGLRLLSDSRGSLVVKFQTDNPDRLRGSDLIGNEVSILFEDTGDGQTGTALAEVIDPGVEYPSLATLFGDDIFDVSVDIAEDSVVIDFDNVVET